MQPTGLPLSTVTFIEGQNPTFHHPEQAVPPAVVSHQNGTVYVIPQVQPMMPAPPGAPLNTIVPIDMAGAQVCAVPQPSVQLTQQHFIAAAPEPLPLEDVTTPPPATVTAETSALSAEAKPFIPLSSKARSAETSATMASWDFAKDEKPQQQKMDKDIALFLFQTNLQKGYVKNHYNCSSYHKSLKDSSKLLADRHCPGFEQREQLMESLTQGIEEHEIFINDKKIWKEFLKRTLKYSVVIKTTILACPTRVFRI